MVVRESNQRQEQGIRSEEVQKARGTLVSGNGENGISFSGGTDEGDPAPPEDNYVQGNLIGTNRGGFSKLENQLAGVLIHNSLENLIGGNETGARNIISGNRTYGVQIDGGVSRKNE